MSKNYTLQQSPNTTGYPSPEFDKGAFDAAITQKGYRIYQERAAVSYTHLTLPTILLV